MADLPDDLRLKFDTYSLDVIILNETDEEEVREMFLRLQNGTTLKAQERRNALAGKMRDFVRELAGHAFFEKCGFANSRYTFDLVAAQMTAKTSAENNYMEANKAVALLGALKL